MILLVGLGNPGDKYSHTRHNAGFDALDFLAEKMGVKAYSRKFHSNFAQIEMGQEKIVFLRPETFMNNSGTAVAEAAGFFKIPLDDVIVLHDDLDLALGKMKVKKGGGHGGNNGLRSIDAHFGNEYWRIRIGIGHPGNREMVHNHVLGKWNKEEIPIIGCMFDAIKDHHQLIISKSFDLLQTKIAEDLARKLS